MTLPGITAPVAPVIFRPDLMSQLHQLGLLGSLQIALDAGEAASYNPAAQTAKWQDLSGNGQDFYRGSSSVGDTAEPAFNGVTGSRTKNEYWSFDGGDRFSYDVVTEPWMDAMHKNNALWTFATWYWPVSASWVQSIMSTSRASTSTIDPGVDLIQDVNPGNAFRLSVVNGSARNTFSSTLGLVMGTWNFAAVSVDEANGVYQFQVNSNGESRALGGYTSPSTGFSSALYLGDSEGGATEFASGTRMAIAMFWSTALSLTQLSALRNAMLPRFA